MIILSLVCNSLLLLLIRSPRTPIPLHPLLSPLMTILHLLLRMIHSSYALQKSTILSIYFTDSICFPLISCTPLLTMPNIFDSFCTTNGLYTHYDWNVIKLLNSSQVFCSHFDPFYADLLPTPAVPSPSSSCPVPAPVDLCLSQPFFTVRTGSSNEL